MRGGVLVAIAWIIEREVCPASERPEFIDATCAVGVQEGAGRFGLAIARASPRARLHLHTDISFDILRFNFDDPDVDVATMIAAFLAYRYGRNGRRQEVCRVIDAPHLHESTRVPVDGKIEISTRFVHRRRRRVGNRERFGFFNRSKLDGRHIGTHRDQIREPRVNSYHGAITASTRHGHA